MPGSVSKIASLTRVPGTATTFPVAPDDDTRRMLWRWHQDCGDVYAVPAEGGASRYWVIHDPDLLQRILVRNSANYTKGMGLERVRILLGNGIMVSEGDSWTRQRRLQRLANLRREFDFFGHPLAARSKNGDAMSRRTLIDEVMCPLRPGRAAV